jgi:Catalytic LigB subunit of aromatic ring-opening dioxygenase
MAQLCFGFGTSHGPLLSTPPDKWDLRAADDRRNRAHAFRDGTYTFEELYELRKHERFEEQVALAIRTERHARCQHQLQALAERVAAAKPDVMVLIGDDQREWFRRGEAQPTFAVYHGDQVINTAADPEGVMKRAPAMFWSHKAHHPETDQSYPVQSDLALHIVEQAMRDAFDVATVSEVPREPDGSPRGIGHAFGFVFRRVLLDRPIPFVPVLVNTFYPPNQATPKRCYEFGQSIARAIQSWGADKRVCVAASGGLSHFVIDEEWDQRILQAFRTQDAAALAREPNIVFRSGTSETKNWIIACGALAQAGLEMDLLDYVPCYRSEAGTGNAMAFATWS